MKIINHSIKFEVAKYILYTVVFVLISYRSYAVSGKPLVYIVATGGTIAGVAASKTSTIYKAGSLGVEQFLQSVPELTDEANIKFVQLFNKDSGDLTIKDWLMLSQEVNKLLKDPSVAGVVVTHGTDTMDATAYFLDLTVKSKKPVVLVGAMRPATSLSADGPMNLYNAVAVAADKASVGRGVMVCMNDGIFDARDVSKFNTNTVDAFKSLATGPIGLVIMGDPKYYSIPMRKNTTATPFNVLNKTSLPEVAIVYEYVGIDTKELLRMIQDAEIKGIVIAGVGNGNIPDYQAEFIKTAIKRGIVVVRSSRVPSGYETDNYNNLDTTYGTIAADDLNPQKARILLMLSLTITSDPKKIEQYFKTY